MRQRRRTFVRDQHASAFHAALMRLCDAVSCVGAALVDSEGETVDYAGNIDPFEIKIAAAEMSILLSVLRQTPVLQWRDTEEVTVRGTKRTFYAHVLEDGYAVVLALPPRAFTISRRAISEAIRELCVEGGLRLPPSIARDGEQWLRVLVRCPLGSRRPNAVWANGSWCRLEVLGIYKDDARRGECGYRARLDSGAEITLVREPFGRWYADSQPGK